MNSSKTDSMNEYPFQIYTGDIPQNKKKSNDKIGKNFQINSNKLNISYDTNQYNPIHMNKTYKNYRNIKYIINNNSCDNSQDNSHDNNEKNYYTFVVNVPKDQGQDNTNIIKLQNMNYLSISPSKQVVYSTYHKNKEKNSLVMSNFKQKICNNTEYEFEHIFNNNINNGNIKKSCSARDDTNLMKINSINSLYVRNNTKYLMKEKMKIDDEDRYINNKNMNNSNINNKNGGGTKSSSNNICYIF